MKIKILSIILLMLGISLSTFAQKKKNKDKAKTQDTSIKLETKLDTVSYCLGVIIGKNLSQSGFSEFKSPSFVAGTNDIFTKKTPVFDDTKANEIVRQFFMDLHKAKIEKTLAEGKAFLEKNKTDSGVVVLASGLQYKILKEGNGPKPEASSKVTVHYHGTLIDGKVFDSSIEKGQPIQLGVDNVIEGWKEALKLMPVGSKWKLFVPSNLAYGENPPQGGLIEPNMVLIFEVELISIDKDQIQTQP